MKAQAAIYLSLVIFSFAGCKPESEIPRWVNPNTLSQGPIIHENLSADQIAKITHLKKVFEEVDPTPLNKWIEDFSRDHNPDREIKIWEGMAQPFESFAEKRTLSIQAKKEVYQVVLLRSGASDEETLKHMKPTELSEADIREILSMYSATPEPIRVYKK